MEMYLIGSPNKRERNFINNLFAGWPSFFGNKEQDKLTSRPQSFSPRQQNAPGNGRKKYFSNYNEVMPPHAGTTTF